MTERNVTNFLVQLNLERKSPKTLISFFMAKNNTAIIAEEKQMAAGDVAVVMVPLPAQGHLNQFLHLSNLISGYGFPVHFVGTPNHNHQAQVRYQGLDREITSKIEFHDFPTPPFPAPPPNPNTSDKLPVQMFSSFKSITHLREPIYELVKELSVTSRRVVVIHDYLMCYVVQDVPTVPNAESYTFQSVSAFTVHTFLWEKEGKPVLVNGETVNELWRSARGVNLPKEFKEFMQLHGESRKASWGNLYNTSRAIDGEYLNMIAQEPPYSAEKHWAIGPFNPMDTTKTKASEKSHKCLDWLDNQPTDSVIYVSFGSTTSLCDRQIEEIAVGLDSSGPKFIWVLRDADRADIFVGDSRRVKLPEGYEKRITEQGKGIIIRDWAPQLEILGHSSTGGFMSHCGWNSCIESISLGVPMAAWPMHSDQPRNAILVTKYLKMGIRVGDWGHEGELVKADEIEKAAKRLMKSSEGDELRKKAAKIRDDIKESVAGDGSGTTELDAFVAHLTHESCVVHLS